MVGVHKYVVPPEAFNVVLVPLQIVTLEPTFADKGITVTVTDALEEHPEEVPVTIYAVEFVGDATGLETVELLSPVAGDQL